MHSSYILKKHTHTHVYKNTATHASNLLRFPAGLYVNNFLRQCYTTLYTYPHNSMTFLLSIVSLGSVFDVVGMEDYKWRVYTVYFGATKGVFGVIILESKDITSKVTIIKENVW